jgi:hypothetical protein
MKNGFLVQIMNTIDIAQEIQLFSEQLPDGLSVQSLDGLLDHAALRQIAMIHGFTGNSITSDFYGSIQLIIHNNGKKEYIELNGRYERSNIQLDHNDNYITVICPANSRFTFRLFSLPEGI